MKKVIIFDMDGVLFDTIPYAREVFMQRYPGVTEVMYNNIHSGNYHENAKKHLHLKIQETEEEKALHSANYALKKSQTPLFPGIKQLLEKLHSLGYLLVLNTNAYNKNALPLLENSGIEKLFDFAATADISKDKVEKFKLIQEKYNITGSDALFVTDALGDVIDAHEAHIPTIAVTWGVHDRSYFDQERYKNLLKIVDTVDDLKNFIKSY